MIKNLNWQSSGSNPGWDWLSLARVILSGPFGSDPWLIVIIGKNNKGGSKFAAELGVDLGHDGLDLLLGEAGGQAFDGLNVGEGPHTSVSSWRGCQTDDGAGLEPDDLCLPFWVGRLVPLSHQTKHSDANLGSWRMNETLSHLIDYGNENNNHRNLYLGTFSKFGTFGNISELL